MTSTVATLAAAATEELRVLPIPAWSYGAIAFGSFMVLLGVLWSFRNTAAKYDTPIRVSRGGPDDPQAARQAADPGAHH
jgi:hypothetical protein